MGPMEPAASKYRVVVSVRHDNHRVITGAPVRVGAWHGRRHSEPATTTHPGP